MQHDEFISMSGTLRQELYFLWGLNFWKSSILLPFSHFLRKKLKNMHWNLVIKNEYPGRDRMVKILAKDG